MAKAKKTPDSPRLPDRPVDQLLVPVRRFLHVESASGVLLVICTVIALILANSAWASAFYAIWKTPVSLTFGSFVLEGDLGHLVINDGLMTIFFFVVGLEVKREIVAGELNDPRKALLPVVGALGGTVAPALIFLLQQWGEPGQRGWAIPMATDIAFVVGVLAMFGQRVPFGLKIFLLTLAIVDDLVAVLIIALVFNKAIAWGWLLVAVAGFIITMLFNRIGVRAVPVYVVVGAFIWLGFLKAGIHPTVAGVMLGLLTPSTAWIGRATFFDVFTAKWNQLRGADKQASEPLPVDVEKLQLLARESVSPLHRLEMGLHPWVAFGIMPIFALANAGVKLDLSSLSHPVSIAVASGLFIGKPLGILSFCAVAVWLGLTRLPEGVTWRMLTAGACLAGIGFTMALFLNSLAFGSDESFRSMELAGKIGTLSGSLMSVILGSVLLLLSLRPKPTAPTT
ncbi:Na+/H+ antiporter NhaA [Tuwongella immobilis]|uniref:Na(+)/H(+) antiporter NhaA n=1 Tax=Tuwongella immobilis TaxID=692036 RepID=A0A6C2YX28_9BACT|nr:Na+/H+ antiporter NhaA [Tuwongella immobilis]VIP05449.1 sodium:proton antiporter : Na(+)/H(+) antiporter NhaA OS=Isosphaera pallida (strain ATCC 43644 / DSM 9630 / IS1B) GN=nhaA PE=3 SV=1: Na_H_antiport_1 [Tuwongella immobilis]VTS08254.1 sodium:proton antiporter : Na(+)/H(+) antiporter NhaA OS=Isosphaera pallida (strain ATCC 43644 / DSM 9630 / IS1B) GN=nhaA PE=3 SV=1: Na_H_antiport_1 [Tuwongella immobilis]